LGARISGCENISDYKGKLAAGYGEGEYFRGGTGIGTAQKAALNPLNHILGQFKKSGTKK